MSNVLVEEQKLTATEPQLLDTPLQKPERNMGVELFRIFSMFLVVCLHLFGHGGVMGATKDLSGTYKLASFLQVITYCSVNCYALISGFANVKTKFKFRRFTYLWLQTVFLITVVNIAVHFLPLGVEVKKEWWIAGFLPLTKRELWYLCAYFFMYPLFPVLNKGLLALNKRQHIAVMIMLQAPTVFRLIQDKDNYVLGGGYSAIWLICLYVIGAYFRIYGAPKWGKWFVTLPIFFVSAFAAWLAKILPEELVDRGLMSAEAREYTARENLISYISPLVVIMSVMLLIFFMQIKISNKTCKTVIATFAKATWGVFVIHVTSAFWYWKDFWSSFKKFGAYSPLKMMLYVIMAGLVVYVGLSVISMLQDYLFKVLRVNRGVDYLIDLPAKLSSKNKKTEQE